MTPQEIQLPKDPYINGQPIEAYLYKHASECPICFLYYPPYLNKTRCCDQPICSECFVQIRRPDPHPPEHADPSDPNPPAPPPSGTDEYMLVSEPATCPFCKQPEFGITYDPPPYRRGLTYANQLNGHPLANVSSAMSSSSSLNSQGAQNRRRTTSLGANSPGVITTDRIRPDWAKKLADARAHALRRAAAATALHNAAYVLGSVDGGGRFQLGRRRRTFFGPEGDSPAGINLGNVGALLAAAGQERHNARTQEQEHGSDDLFPGRGSSRRGRIEDIEELMMMEAIRMSLAEEERRKEKEEKEAAKKATKEAKKEEKQRQKDAKKAGKTSRKSSMYPLVVNDSSGSQLTTGESSAVGAAKGKAIDRSGIAQSQSPDAGSPIDPIPPTFDLTAPPVESGNQPTHAPMPIGEPPNHRAFLGQLHNQPSSASSLSEQPPETASSLEPSPSASGLNLEQTPFGTETPPSAATPSPGVEPMFNFSSLAAVVDNPSPMSENQELGSQAHTPTPPVNGSSDSTQEAHPSSPTIEVTPPGPNRKSNSKHTAAATVVDKTEDQASDGGQIA
jgi:hypothetical protein